MNRKSPCISVLMPVYNAGNYIGEAIESVLQQTFTDFEFIIVNDGSTDNTASVILSYSDPRIRVISQKNKGIAAALNLGLQHCTAPLVARFDADDICYRERLETQFKLFQKDPALSVCSSPAHYMDEESNYVFTWYPPAFSSDEIHNLYQRTCPFIHSGVMYKKQVVIRCGGYNENAHSFEDHFLWVKLFNKGAAGINVQQPLLKVRLNPQSVTIDEKWRGRRFRNIKKNCLESGLITEKQGEQLKNILARQDKHSVKAGAYHTLIGKKYLWNNYQPKNARLSFKKAIRMRPFHAAVYGLLALSYLSKPVINRVYKTLRFD
jgi:glycosyltransferase involved in cell wall biosynthesis